MATSQVSKSFLSFQPFRLINQLLCAHPDEIKKVDGSRLYVECMDCGRNSPGIKTGGHNFGGAR